MWWAIVHTHANGSLLMDEHFPVLLSRRSVANRNRKLHEVRRNLLRAYQCGDLRQEEWAITLERLGVGFASSEASPESTSRD
jgi:hypothetical protein